jgi:DNA polymerase-3 subunit epsilon
MQKSSATTRKKAKKAEPAPVYFSRFVALDFETADYGRDSACAIGVVVVENRKIVAQFSELIRPPRRSIQFTWLHGIAWEHVADKPTFSELWPKLQPVFDGADFIAAHNAGFDRGVLDECCTKSGHARLEKKYLCTMRLARKLWDIRPTKLSDVCGQFGIDLNHHDAGSDALACAKIVMRADGSGVPESAFLKAAKKPVTA